MPSTALLDYFLHNPGYVICKLPHYFPVYERHFKKFRGTKCLIMEIGCAGGGSLQMWKHYFGPEAQIVGLDINPNCAARVEERIRVRIGDQADPAFLARVLNEVGVPDIVIDDGSHRASDTIAAFDFLFPRLAPRGVYCVEDLHTAYWPEFEGGLGRPGTFVEKCKGFIDTLNAYHTQGALPPSAFTDTTRSMHVYDSIVVFEKGPRNVLPLSYSWGIDGPRPHKIDHSGIYWKKEGA